MDPRLTVNATFSGSTCVGECKRETELSPIENGLNQINSRLSILQDRLIQLSARLEIVKEPIVPTSQAPNVKGESSNDSSLLQQLFVIRDQIENINAGAIDILTRLQL